MNDLITEHHSLIWLILSMYSIVVFMPFQTVANQENSSPKLIVDRAGYWLVFRFILLIICLKIQNF